MCCKLAENCKKKCYQITTKLGKLKEMAKSNNEDDCTKTKSTMLKHEDTYE